MLLNNGKGWEAGNVCFLMLLSFRDVSRLFQTPATLLAQAHANASSPSPHRDREHRRDRDHGHRRISRAHQDASGPSTPLVLSPAPAHVKSSRRPAAERGAANRPEISVQPLTPANRRASQQRETGGMSSPHPYAAAPSPSGYQARRDGQYGRQSPGPGNFNGSTGAFGHALPNGSGSFMYAQHQPGKTGTESREGTRDGHVNGGVRGMTVYDRDQMQRMGEHEEGHGRKKGFWSTLCCR
jgi:casein kinase 1